MYCTHSPYFVDIPNFDLIRKVNNVRCHETQFLKCDIIHFTLEEAAKELARISHADARLFTRNTFVARPISTMNTIVNEGYFADLVVLVEGTADVGVLVTVSEILNLEWNKKNIVIVPVVGKSNLDRPSVIFKGLKIPTYIIFDGDSRKKDKDGGTQAIKLNHQLLRLVGGPEDNFPKTQINEEWAVFENDIENELIDDLGSKEIFYKYRDAIANNFEFSPSKLMKNAYGAKEVVNEIYRQGNQLPTMEKLVQAIDELYKSHY
ncbi:MAG: ATP-dependent endonuclease [Calditrichaeota bacterium]|nr:MAG: ATP-dependent endonuclease [Calditrichota bacterium]